jgi:dynein heavy chain
MGELFGDYHEVTGEWTNGIAANFMRDYASREDETYRWIVFDGPVDSRWVENMNSVLDDNMMLSLANTERIKLKAE